MIDEAIVQRTRALAQLRRRIARGPVEQPCALSLEELVTRSDYCGLRASNPQRALMRAAEGQPLKGILRPDQLSRHFGLDDEHALAEQRPRFITVRAGRGAAKSLIAVHAGLRNALNCRSTWITVDEEGREHEGGFGRNDLLRMPIVAPALSLTHQTFRHALTTVKNSPLRRYLQGELKQSFVLRRPDGFEVWVGLVAESAGGANLRSVWIPSMVLDEADFHLHAGDDPVVKLEDNIASVHARLTPDSQVWVVSSPWLEGSEFDARFHRAWGQPGANLSFHSKARDMNPSLPREPEQQMRQEDPERAAREYDALPSALATMAFFPEEAVRACTATRTGPRPEGARACAKAGTDLGFAKNSSALAIAWPEAGKAVLGYHEERIPQRGAPLKPRAVVKDFARAAASYGVQAMRGDHWYTAATQEALEELGEVPFPDGIARQPAYHTFDPSPENVTRMCVKVKELLVEGLVELPNDPRLLGQLRAVRKRQMPNTEVRAVLPNQGASHGDLALAAIIALAEMREFVGDRPPPPKPGRSVGYMHDNFGNAM